MRALCDAAIALRFENALELLISVMLSAQTTDVNVNRVTATLFQKYRRPEDYLAVPLEKFVQSDGSDGSIPSAVRRTAAIALAVWVGVITTGRFIAYLQ